MATINDLANSFIKGGNGSSKGPLNYIVDGDDLLALYEYVHNQENCICEDINVMNEILKCNVKDVFINAINFMCLYCIKEYDETHTYHLEPLYIEGEECIDYDTGEDAIDKDSITGYLFNIDMQGIVFKIAIKKDLSSIKLMAKGMIA